MTFEPSDVQAAVAATARSFARERIAPAAAANDREERFPEDLVKGLGELGLLAVNVPAAHGGSEAGAVAYALALMEIAAADCATATVVAVTNMVGEVIARFGSEEQKRRHLPRLATGEWLAGAFALSEPQAGSDAAALSTRAVRRGDGWVLDGAKQWITSGDVAGVTVVWARTGEPGPAGVTAFLVERGTPGLTAGRREEKMGIRASPTVSLTLEGCQVPDSARLGGVGEGFAIALDALDGGRIGIGAQAVGTLTAALEASVRYAKERRTFGRPIAEHQAIGFMLADMATDRDAARLLVLRAAGLKEAGRPFGREAAMAKLLASEAAQRAVSRAVQIHGGYGYAADFAVERLFRDARVQTIYEGTSEIQRLVIARHVLQGAGGLG
ncbi:MAG TPA: acyl-CoA dehydrogenase family protein [Anaeromyxobacteraceae bacterium]|nr:acyl-CoA dehydrogenase family protein [Anaeromyxobacteraceae bacterium]